MEMIVEGVKVCYLGDLTSEEVEYIARDEIAEYKDLNEKINKIMLTPAGDSVIVETELKAQPGQIIRLRRITGYLSNIENFNEAKAAELRDRSKHDK